MSNSISNLVTPTPSQARENSYLFRPISPAISIWEPELSPRNNNRLSREDGNNSTITNQEEEEEQQFGSIEISCSFDEWDTEALSSPHQEQEDQSTLKYKPTSRRNADESNDINIHGDFDNEDDSYGSIKVTYSFDEWDREDEECQQEGSEDDSYDEEDDSIDKDDDDSDPYGTIKRTYSFDEWNEPPLRRPSLKILKKKASTNDYASVFRFDQWDANEDEEYDEDHDNEAKFLTKCPSTKTDTTSSMTHNRSQNCDLAIQPSNTTLSGISSKWDMFRTGDSPRAFQPVVKKESFDKDKLIPLDTWSSSYIECSNEKRDDGDVLPPAAQLAPRGSIPDQEQPKSPEKSQMSSSSWQHVDIPQSIEVCINYHNDQNSVASPSSTSSSSSYPEFKLDSTAPSSQPIAIPDFVLLHQALAMEQPSLQLQPKQQQRKSWCQKSISKFFASRGRRAAATIQSEL